MLVLLGAADRNKVGDTAYLNSTESRMRIPTDHTHFQAHTGVVYTYAVRFAVEGEKVTWIADVNEGTDAFELCGAVVVSEPTERDAQGRVEADVNRQINLR